MEKWDILNSRGDTVGKVAVRGQTPLKSGEYHLVVHIWVISADGKLLVQRRSDSKKLMPGEWAATGGAAAIGGGKRGYVDSITITGGTVIATRSDQTAGYVGSSYDSNNCTVVLSGGNIKASQVRGVSVTDGNGNNRPTEK